MLEFKAALNKKKHRKHLRSPGSVVDTVSGLLVQEEAKRDIKIFFPPIHLQSFTFMETLARQHRLQIDNDLRSALE